MTYLEIPLLLDAEDLKLPHLALELQGQHGACKTIKTRSRILRSVKSKPLCRKQELFSRGKH
jgi:hypothetical protein